VSAGDIIKLVCSFNYPLDPPLQAGQYFLGVPLPIQ
jgi:hypothetical protein